MSTDNLENQASNNIFEAYVKALRNYFNFKGRTSRYDYWGFWLTDMLVIIIFSVLSVFLKETPAFSSLSDNLKQAYGLLLIIPRIAAIVRLFTIQTKVPSNGFYCRLWYLFCFCLVSLPL